MPTFNQTVEIDNTTLNIEITVSPEDNSQLNDIMRIIISNDQLVIGMNDSTRNGDFTVMAHIDVTGNCYFLNTKERRNAYRRWLDSGAKTSPEIKEWHNKEYRISSKGSFRCTCEDGLIFKFADARFCPGCMDDNIVRYDANKTPVGFTEKA